MPQRDELSPRQLHHRCVLPAPSCSALWSLFVLLSHFMTLGRPFPISPFFHFLLNSSRKHLQQLGRPTPVDVPPQTLAQLSEPSDPTLSPKHQVCNLSTGISRPRLASRITLPNLRSKLLKSGLASCSPSSAHPGPADLSCSALSKLTS